MDGFNAAESPEGINIAMVQMFCTNGEIRDSTCDLRLEMKGEEPGEKTRVKSVSHATIVDEAPDTTCSVYEILTFSREDVQNICVLSSLYTGDKDSRRHLCHPSILFTLHAPSQ